MLVRQLKTEYRETEESETERALMTFTFCDLRTNYNFQTNAAPYPERAPKEMMDGDNLSSQWSKSVACSPAQACLNTQQEEDGWKWRPKNNSID